MENVVASIKAEWLYKILKGEKTLEYRMTKPKKTPFVLYFYLSKTGNKILDWRYDDHNKVEFLLLDKKRAKPFVEMAGAIVARCIVRACLSTDIMGYKYAWSLDKVEFFKKLKYLRGNIPQSWRYVADNEIIEII